MDNKAISLKNKTFVYMKNILFFIFFAAVFIAYQIYEIEDNGLAIIIAVLSTLIFFLSVYNFKYGLYLFIFLVPLLNSIPSILKIESTPVILFIFFALVLAFFIKNILNVSKGRQEVEPIYPKERWLCYAIGTFIAIFTISALITIYRYANFYPLITSNYHELIINVNNVNSTFAIFWTIEFFFNYIVGFGLLYLVITSFSELSDIKNSVFIIILSTVVSMGVLGYQYFFNPSFGNSEAWVAADRFNATFNDPNSLGNFTIMIFPIFISLIIYFKKVYLKVISFLLFLPFLFMVFISGSRTSFVGIFISILIFIGVGIKKLAALISRKIKSIKIKRAILCIVIFLAILVLISFFLLPNIMSPEIKEKYKPPDTGISLIDRMVETGWMAYNTFFEADLVEAFKSVSSYRHALWDQAIEMFKDHPLTGVGLGSYILQLPNYYVKNNSDITHIDFTGNYYLQLLSELGLPGLILVLLIFFIILKKAFSFYLFRRRNSRRGDILLDGLVISFIAMVWSLFLGPHTNFFEIQFTFWIIISLIVSYASLRSEKNETG